MKSGFMVLDGERKMYKAINGYTKAKMIEKILKYNNGTKASNDEGNCFYEDSRSNRCAIGCFIPDEHIKVAKSIYGGIGALMLDMPYLNSHMPLEPEGLEELQGVHDCFCNYNILDRTLHGELVRWVHLNVED